MLQDFLALVAQLEESIELLPRSVRVQILPGALGWSTRFTDLEAQPDERERAKLEDAGANPAGISRCRSRPIARRERAMLETWVRFPAFAPV